MQVCYHIGIKYNCKYSTVLIFTYALTVPQKGTLRITTEFGKMTVGPEEICVIQVRYNVHFRKSNNNYRLKHFS